MQEKYQRNVINQVCSRMKTADSICRKLLRKKYPMEQESVWKLNDLVGIRVTCLFMDDVYAVAEKIKELSGIQIIKEKDYIKKSKKNGYRSLHLIVDVPVSDSKKTAAKPVRVEIQIRTVAMDCWSVLDYQMLYKKDIKGADSIERELQDYSKTIRKLDKRMVKLRKKIEKLCEK